MIFDRRELLGMLGLGAIAVRKAMAADTAPLRFTALDHVEFLVSDVEKVRGILRASIRQRGAEEQQDHAEVRQAGPKLHRDG